MSEGTQVVDYIDDGYTQSHHIDAVEGVHGPLDFDYRPTLPLAIDKLLDADAKGHEAYMTTAIDLLAVQITIWNKKDRNGQAVPVNRTTLSRLNRELLTAIINAVFWPPKKNADGTPYAKADQTVASLKN